MLGKTTSAIAASALAAAGLLAWSTPAAAATAPQAAAAVPNCVTTSLNDSGATDYLTVYNDCDDNLRIKVLLAYGPDFSCTTIAANGQMSYQWPWPSRFDGLQEC
ncbi:hypothetical protein OUQ99_17520 [Streptomonospora nanhaiensis]|uniref:Alpha amylase inhibitor n=1 Tax=Streptomonospora nanhaiensis TaxID=1323731 RepID=A0ABY6YFP5_9ACTN|nr:hypothetical protein [Streptomonospora nanhaiensis]WAE71035.1 hypothetical protein OUQ99_17520 [Streptomonospora nanhaiensis]